MSTMATGMAFGAGSEIAHQGVRAMMGGGSGHGSAPAEQQQQQVQEQPAQHGYDQPMQQQMPQENPCMGFNQNLISCLQSNKGEISFCQSYMDMLSQCEKDNTRSYNQF